MLLGPDSGGLSQVCAAVRSDDEYPEFARLFFERAEGSRIKLPKAMENAFADPQTDAEREIKAAIDRFNADETARLEQDLFRHRARLAEAERSLEYKVTKKATESRGIVCEQIEWTLGRLEDIRRTGCVDQS